MTKFFLPLFFLTSTIAVAQSDADVIAKVQAALQRNNVNEAFVLMNSALQKDPDNFALKQVMATVQYKRHAYSDAAPLIQMLIDKNVDVDANKFRLLECLYGARKYEEVLTAAKTIDASKLSNEEQGKYHATMGNAYHGINYTPQSIESWQKSLSLVPNQKDLIRKIATAYEDLTLYEKCLDYHKQLLVLDSSNYRTWFDAGVAAENTKRRSEAINYFLKSKALGHPDNVDINFEIANTYYDLKDYRNSVLFLEKAAKIAPYNQDVASLQAYCYYYIGDLALARKKIEDMIAINPENGDLQYLVGMTWQKAGKMDKAERYFEKAFKLKPELERLRVSKMDF